MTESLEMTKEAGPTAANAAEPEPADADEPAEHFARHVELRTVVLPELRVLFLPVPKAGWTTVLWLLAEAARLPLEIFEHSTLPGPSTSLTVHDMSLWGPGRRLADYEGDERERILTEDGWFRFSLVRSPQTRLWSAWQSKLLLREPRFVTLYGEEPWFPRVPDEPDDLVEDFRRFAAAVRSGEAKDVHWAVQHELVSQLPLQHVGRLEHLDETLALLREHLPDDRWPSAFRHENRTPVPLPPHAYDEAAADALAEHYRADFEGFSYEPPEPSEDPDAVALWTERVAPLLPGIKDTVDKHARIGQLYRIAGRVQMLEKRLETVATRTVGHASAPVLTNLEGHTDFNVHWAWADGKLEPGFTAVVRAKNEEAALPWVLPPLLRAVRHVVLIDNDSTDGTVDVARRTAEEAGAADRLEIHSYPFSVARCGDEHLGTPAESVHNLAYFYNWSFAHVRTGYSLKWDADMVLTDTGINILRDLAWQLEASEVVVKIPRYPLYVADDRHAFLDIGMSNCEPWAWANRPGYRFVKAMEWEQPEWPADLPEIILPDWSSIELKHLDADEFAHWSHTDFGTTSRTQRKRREWEVFRSLAEGGAPPADVVAIEAPEGQHVIDYVRSTWLADKAAERPDLGERLIRHLIG